MLEPEKPRSRYLEVYEISIVTDCESGPKVWRNPIQGGVQKVNMNIKVHCKEVKNTTSLYL